MNWVRLDYITEVCLVYHVQLDIVDVCSQSVVVLDIVVQDQVDLSDVFCFDYCSLGFHFSYL